MKSLIFSTYLLFLFTQVSAQHVSTNFPETNQRVIAMAEVGDTLFMGGDFTRVYGTDSSTNYGGVIDYSTGRINGRWARPNGSVYAAIPDGNNGFYIGGNFTRVGDSLRSRIAHIDNNGQVTSRLLDGVNGPVRSLALKNNTLYMGGDFSACGVILAGTAGAAVDQDGNLRKNFPAVNGHVFSVISDGKSGWYIAGSFTKVGEYTRGGMARIDKDGHVYSWNPDVQGSWIRSMLLAGNTLYIGGSFTTAGGQTRNALAALDARTGALLPFNPDVASSNVTDMVIHNNILYIGGTIYYIGSQPRNNLAAVDLATGMPTSWAPVLNGDVARMIVSGNKLYVFGGFSDVSGQARTRLAAFNLPSGTLTSWNPNGATDFVVNTMGVLGNKVYVGGQFTTIGGQSRGGGAAFDTGTAALAPWNPHANGTIDYLVTSGNTVYAGGEFSNIGGANRAYLAALDTANGNALTGWNPGGIPGSTLDMAISGKQLYVGGFYLDGYSIGGQARSYLAAADVNTSLFSDWAPNPNSKVWKLYLHNNNILYAGGDFTTIKGTNRSRMAAFDLSHDSLLPWNPGANDVVNDLVISGGNMYVCGGFTQIGGQTRNYIAALDTGSGLATSWNPAPNSYVSRLALASDRLYAGGQFTTISGVSRSYIAAYYLSSLGIAPFNPAPNNQVNAIYPQGAKVYLGGSFDIISGLTRNKIAQLDTGGSITAWSTYADATVQCFATAGSYLFAGGDFSVMGGVLRNHLAAIIKSTGAVTAWNPDCNGTIYVMTAQGNKIYFGGAFTQAGTQVRNNAAAADRNTGAVLPWNPNTNSYVNSIQPYNAAVYLGGNFTSAGGQTRNRLAAVDSLSGTLTSWNPNATGVVSAMAISGTTLFAGGSFTNVSSQTRYQLAAFDLVSGSLTSWNPNSAFANNGVRCLFADGNKLYVGGSFTFMGGQNRTNLAVLSTTTGLADAWAPTTSSFINGLVRLGKKVYFCGNFDAASGQTRNYLAATDTLTGKLSNWNPGTSFTTNVVTAPNHTIYAGGLFGSAGGVTRNNLAAIDADFELSIDTIPVVTYCTGSVMPVKFSFDPVARSGNIFSVQLSDSTGNFDNPITLNTQASLTGGAILCTIPAGILSGNNYRVRIVGSNPMLISNDNGYDLKLRAAPAPKAGFTASSYAQCINAAPFAFTDTSTISSGSLKRVWYFDTDTSTASPASKVYITAGTFPVKLVVTSLPGCADSVTKTVVAYPKSTPGFTVNNSAQCLNNHGFLFSDTSSISTGTLTRSWDLGDGTNSTLAGPSKTYTAAGTYQVKLVSTSDHGCKDSISKNVSLRPKPHAAATATGATSFCPGSSVSLGADSSNGPFTYQWMKNNIPIPFSMQLSYVAATSGNYSVIVKDSNTCADTSSVIPVVLFPKPKVSFTVNRSSQCINNQSFVFADTSAIDSGTMTRAWKFGDSTFSVSANPSKIYTVTGSYLVKLILTSNHGCADSVAKNVTVNGIPAVTSTAGGTTAFCPGGSVALHANTGAGLNYRWLKNNAAIAATLADYTATASGNYRVIVSNANSCEDTSVAIPVHVYPETQAEFTVNSSSQCLNRQHFIFTDSSVTDSGTITRTWYIGDSLFAVTGSFSTTFAAAGNYSVKLISTGNHGCTDSVTHVVTVHAAPAVHFLLPFDSIVVSAAPVTLTGGSPAGGIYSGPAVSSGIFSPVSAGLGIHQLTYAYTDVVTGCSDSAQHAVRVLPNTGIDEHVTDQQLLLYPNPVSNELTLVLPHSMDYTAVITDMQGKVIATEYASRSGRMRINVSQLVPALYHIRIVSDEQVYHGHFIKE